MISEWLAKWIWARNVAKARNITCNVCRRFYVQKSIKKAVLRISADSRYRLYLNAEWLGDGPARSFPHLQQYDIYDVTHVLNEERNCLAVSVVHYGESTFQYVLGRGGVLCQLEIEYDDGSVQTLCSDSTWKIEQENALVRPTARISCQMPFEEIVDARRQRADWYQIDYDDSGWPNAVEIGSVGCDPWSSLQSRSIPFLTRTPVYPVRLLEQNSVRPLSLQETVSVKQALIPADKSSNKNHYRGFICTLINSEKDQTAVIKSQFTLFAGPWSLNGEQIESPEQKDVPVKLKAGDNLFIADLIGTDHNVDFALAIDAEAAIKLKAPFEGPGKWLIVGPLDPDEEKAQSQANALHDLKKLKAFPEVHHFTKHNNEEIPVDVWNSVYSQQTLASDVSCLADAEHFLFDHAGWTTVAKSDADIEILLDFGREWVGYTEFELMAPEGVVLDFYFFEAINNGKRQHTWFNRNAFRYITREGRQRYISRWRRGHRYMSITFRNVIGDVHIKYLRTLFSTYAAAEQGAFQCSDDKLNQIWRVGRHTLRCCMEDTFTDCPTFEQTFWVGDARNEALVCYAAYGAWELVERCVKLAAQSLYNSPLPQSQVPSGWQNILTAWSLLWVQMVDEYCFYSGNPDALKTLYPAVKKTLETCKKQCKNRYGLLSIEAWNMFDWSGQDDEHALVLHNNMFLVSALQCAINMANALRLFGDVEHYKAFKHNIIAAINEHAWSDTWQAYVDSIHADGQQSETISQQTNTLALLYDIAPEKRKKSIKKYTDNPPDRMVKFGSPFAMFYLLEALAKEERFGAVLHIIRQKWGYMLDAGATTFWEMFPGYLKHVPTRSHCHAWSAAPTWFLSRYQLGVSPLQPGFSKVLIRPRPEDLSWARGSVPTPKGTITTSWKRSERSFQFQVILPAPIKARVEIPFVTDPEHIYYDRQALVTELPECVVSVDQNDEHLIFEIRNGAAFYCHAIQTESLIA